MKITKYDNDAETAIQSIEKAFGVSITLHDLRGTIRHPDGEEFLLWRHRHGHSCCCYERLKRPGWDDRCYRECFTNTERTGDGKSYYKTCWKGLGELVVPLIHEKHHLLTIYAGVFRSREAENNPDCPQDPEYRHMLSELPEADHVTLRELEVLLQIFGHGLLHCLCREEIDQPVNRGYLVRDFIRSNAHKQITIHDLAKKLNLSPSRTSHTVREHTGMTFRQLLLQERMLRAQKLLCNSRESLDEVAEAVGFNSGFYFNRQFRSYFGMPPGEYRLQHQGGQGKNLGRC